MAVERLLYIVDDEAIVRASIVSLVQAHGAYRCREYGSGEAFLAALDHLEPGCVVLDLQLDGESGMAVMRALSQQVARFPMVIVTGFSDLATAIDAFAAGAVDFLHKPYAMRALLDAIDRGFHRLAHGVEPPAQVERAQAGIARLSPVEAEILTALLAGRTNQDVAADLDVDARTIQVHRARALAALDAPSILDAMRIAAIAGWPPAP